MRFFYVEFTNTCTISIDYVYITHWTLRSRLSNERKIWANNHEFAIITGRTKLIGIKATQLKIYVTIHESFYAWQKYRRLYFFSFCSSFCFSFHSKWFLELLFNRCEWTNLNAYSKEANKKTTLMHSLPTHTYFT